MLESRYAFFPPLIDNHTKPLGDLFPCRTLGTKITPYGIHRPQRPKINF